MNRLEKGEVINVDEVLLDAEVSGAVKAFFDAHLRPGLEAGARHRVEQYLLPSIKIFVQSVFSVLDGNMDQYECAEDFVMEDVRIHDLVKELAFALKQLNLVNINTLEGSLGDIVVALFNKERGVDVAVEFANSDEIKMIAERIWRAFSKV